MNLFNEIGGYPELDLNRGDLYHQDAILLNTGRTCFEYILKAQKTTHVYMPKYTCDVMLEPLKKLDIKYTFYSINENLEISEDINPDNDELLVYTNYFGIKDTYCDELISRHGSRLVIDASQAFYYKAPIGSNIFYSPRKFFGLPDGGILYTEKKIDYELERDVSYNRFSHLIKRIDLGAEQAYGDFKNNDKILENIELKEMSLLTERLLGNIDYQKGKAQRLANFKYLHSQFGEINKLNIDDVKCPMSYPLYLEKNGLREEFISNKIFVPTYWPNTFDWCEKGDIEYNLAKNILPLPIDQRYSEQDLNKIVEVFNEYNN